MQEVATDRTPPLKAVAPFFVAGALSLFLAAVLLFLKASEIGTAHYFQPQILSITHIAALGWATMVIMGSLHQFVPVVFDVGLHSAKLSIATFAALVSGLAFMGFAFWNFSFGWVLIAGSALVFLAFCIFSVNIFLSIRIFKKVTQEGLHIIASLVWLLVTGAIGLLLAINLHSGFIAGDHLVFLKMHAHFGALGWMLLLLIGVGTKLMPMFSLSHIEKDAMLKQVFVLVNAGLIALAAALFFKASPLLLTACGMLLVAGISRYLHFIFKTYRARIRGKLDAGMQHSYMAFVLLAVPVVFGVILPFAATGERSFRLSVAYGFSYFFGLITVLIIGQTYKMLPFIVWLHKYRSRIGHEKVCLPRDLFNESVAELEGKIYIAGFAVFLAGIIFNISPAKLLGSASIVLAAALYTYNVFSIVFLKPEIVQPKQKAQFNIALPVVPNKSNAEQF